VHSPGILALALVTALGLTACGDDDDGGGGAQSETGNLSRSEWAKQADGLCSKTASDIDALPTAGDPVSLYQGTQPAVQKLVADVDQLVPPEADQDTVDQMLTGFRTIGQAAAKASESIASGTDTATAAATFGDDTADARTQIQSAAGDLGATDCASLGASA
jgi:hypothetical protein